MESEREAQRTYFFSIKTINRTAIPNIYSFNEETALSSDTFFSFAFSFIHEYIVSFLMSIYHRICSRVPFTFLKKCTYTFPQNCNSSSASVRFPTADPTARMEVFRFTPSYIPSSTT